MRSESGNCKITRLFLNKSQFWIENLIPIEVFHVFFVYVIVSINLDFSFSLTYQRAKIVQFVTAFMRDRLVFDKMNKGC